MTCYINRRFVCTRRLSVDVQSAKLLISTELHIYISVINSYLRDFLCTFLHDESCKAFRQLTKQSTTEVNLSISQVLPCASFRDNITLNSF